MDGIGNGLGGSRNILRYVFEFSRKVGHVVGEYREYDPRAQYFLYIFQIFFLIIRQTAVRSPDGDDVHAVGNAFQAIV